MNNKQKILLQSIFCFMSKFIFLT